MISYTRTAFYGLSYLAIRGSALPRCLPPAIVACAINYVAQRWPQAFGASADDADAGQWLGHPYTFQLSASAGLDPATFGSPPLCACLPPVLLLT